MRRTIAISLKYQAYIWAVSLFFLSMLVTSLLLVAHVSFFVAGMVVVVIPAVVFVKRILTTKMPFNANTNANAIVFAVLAMGIQLAGIFVGNSLYLYTGFGREAATIHLWILFTILLIENCVVYVVLYNTQRKLLARLISKGDENDNSSG